MAELIGQQTSEQLRIEHRKAIDAADAAEVRRAEAERYAEQQILANKDLLERLLEKQRFKFEEQLAGCTCQFAARREAAMQQMLLKEKEERVEMMHRQSARRILNAGLTNAWSAWHEMWAAKTYAMERLRECANRLKAPELAQAYSHWNHRWHATVRARMKAEADKEIALLTEEGRRAAYLEEELAKAKAQVEEVLKERRVRLRVTQPRMQPNACLPHACAFVLEPAGSGTRHLWQASSADFPAACIACCMRAVACPSNAHVPSAFRFVSASRVALT